MNIRKVSATLTEIDGRLRVERGPVRRREVATAELLGDATASHYHLPRKEKVKDPATGKDRTQTVVARDAMGKPIEEGKPFDFIDWKSQASAFYVYEKDAEGVWQPLGTHDSEDTAMSAAVTRAAALTGKE